MLGPLDSHLEESRVGSIPYTENTINSYHCRLEEVSGWMISVETQKISKCLVGTAGLGFDGASIQQADPLAGKKMSQQCVDTACTFSS